MKQMNTTDKQLSAKANICKLMRSPEQVMKLDRLGSSHQTRLSFMRTLLRRLKREKWRFEKPVWSINDNGEGHAVYSAIGPRRTYSLIAYAHDLDPSLRSDRVIATAWDATFALFDGVPTEEDIERLSKNVPLQEAGRISDKELCLSRANRSGRLYQHVLDRLAQGEQPDLEQIQSVGYLYRTTAVYGSGKFGAADRFLIQDRELASGPFRLEMLSVFLIRAFSVDLVEHMAKVKGGEKATTIAPHLRRCFGIGNSTGLGMAPFIVNHPALFNNWISAREQAFARVRAEETVSSDIKQQFLEFLERAKLNVNIWHSKHELQIDKIADLKADLVKLSNHISESMVLDESHPWEKLSQWVAKNLSLEGQEQFFSLMIEPYGDLVDELTETMGADEYETFRIDGSQSVSELLKLLETNYHWALDVDYIREKNQAKFWYVSEEKLEPRLGERFEEPGKEFEQPLSTGRDASLLYTALKNWIENKDNEQSKELAYFLLAHPEHRHIVRRVQLQSTFNYAEIQDNLIGSDLLPINMLRCKLSFFGATHFDPRSDRWVRICLYQNAPFPSELEHSAADEWAYPPLHIKADLSVELKEV